MSKNRLSGPITTKPTAQNIKFGEVYINISAIARDTGIDPSWVSRIFSGKRVPSIAHAAFISKSLELSLEEFLVQLKQHRRAIAPRKKRLRRKSIMQPLILDNLAVNSQ